MPPPGQGLAPRQDKGVRLAPSAQGRDNVKAHIQLEKARCRPASLYGRFVGGLVLPFGAISFAKITLESPVA